MRKLICAVTALCVLLGFSPAAQAEGEPRIRAERAVLMSSTGEVLYAHKARERSLIASTTKLMTAILAIENGGLDSQVTAKAEHCAVEGSSMYLRPGEKYTVLELLQGLLLVSGNDAALALAEHVAGDVPGFVERMNQTARRLGMAESHFENPHGLDGEAHYATAEDLGRLMAYCMENERFREIVRARTCQVRGATLVNHNRLLSLCPGCLGGKTGYTKAAGRCLVSCCEREGTRLICVTLDDPQDWRDHQALYDWAFARYAVWDPAQRLSYSLPLLAGEEELAQISPVSVPLLLEKGQEPTLQVELPRFVFAPVQAGQAAGRLRILVGERLLAETNLEYTKSVAADGERWTLWERLRYGTEG